MNRNDASVYDGNLTLLQKVNALKARVIELEKAAHELDIQATASAVTLPAGSNASADVSESGNALHFSFGIPKGDKGDKGDTGETGATGPQGPAGADGATGPQGPQGIQGPAGENGQDGAQGPQGIQGPAGADGVTPNVSMTASVDATTGTPAVSVTKSGTAAEPAFSLAFSGLKGEQGESDNIIPLPLGFGYANTPFEKKWFIENANECLIAKSQSFFRLTENDAKDSLFSDGNIFVVTTGGDKLTSVFTFDSITGDFPISSFIGFAPTKTGGSSEVPFYLIPRNAGAPFKFANSVVAKYPIMDAFYLHYMGELNLKIFDDTTTTLDSGTITGFSPSNNNFELVIPSTYDSYYLPSQVFSYDNTNGYAISLYPDDRTDANTPYIKLTPTTNTAITHNGTQYTIDYIGVYIAGTFHVDDNLDVTNPFVKQLTGEKNVTKGNTYTGYKAVFKYPTLEEVEGTLSYSFDGFGGQGVSGYTVTTEADGTATLTIADDASDLFSASIRATLTTSNGSQLSAMLNLNISS